MQSYAQWCCCHSVLLKVTGYLQHGPPGSLRSRRLEVVGTRKNGRARRTSKRLLRRLAPRLLTYKCGRASQLNCRYLKPYMYINNLKLYWTGYLYKPTLLKEFTVNFFLFFFSFKLHDRTNIDTVSAKSQREILQWT